MITGFNTDIEHNGITYHVQTEDKGLGTPLLLSLVYAGGAILASKRTLYDDLITQGFDEKILADRLQRQHRLICAAIRAGRIEELISMSRREADERIAQKAERKGEPIPVAASEPAAINEPVAAEVVPPAPAVSKPETPPVIPTPRPYMPPTPPPPPPVPLWQSQTPIMMRPAPFGELDLSDTDTEPELNIELVEDRDFRGGEVVALRIRVSREPGGEKDMVADAPVTVKILGTAFRPMICSATTDRDGMAVVFTTLPRFKSGRAAILIRVVVGSQEAEMRRIILPT